MMWFVVSSALLALVFASFLAYFVVKQDPGSKQMRDISSAIREGASAYLKKQDSTIAIFFLVTFVIMLFLAYFHLMNWSMPFLFLEGGFFSGLAGYVGMSIATLANVRTANAARKSLNRALQIAFSSGAVMGLSVVGLALTALSLSFVLVAHIYGVSAATGALFAFGMGASSVALFARLGGGIYTKAADVGADLVGKVEEGIPEDDPRNPAVIADNVGDNVGDVAGMGADLYESYVGSLIAALALGFATFKTMNAILLPLSIAASGILSSIFGFFFVRSNERANQNSLLFALKKGTISASLMIAFLAYLFVRGFGFSNSLYLVILLGLLVGVFIGWITEYYTSSGYKPVKALAKSSLTGAATVMIEGLAVGMLSTFWPVVAISVASLLSFYMSGGAQNFNAGLYGISLAAVGMLSTLGITLATDAYGPVADNAGGIAEMSGQSEKVRKRTDALDALGNTTAATGKGFAIGSAALTSLALIATLKTIFPQVSIEILNPNVMAGLLIGAMLPFLFSSMALRAVGRAASAVVDEVRYQFKHLKLLSGKNKPNYARVVSITTGSAQREMILPSVTAVLSPIVVGILFGPSSLFGLLAGALGSGFVLAIMMSTAGGAWDNAKKFVEDGNHGGKGSSAHSASIVGDTVGDPFKDTAGPSLNILIKLMSMVSIVFAPLILKLALMH